MKSKQNEFQMISLGLFLLFNRIKQLFGYEQVAKRIANIRLTLTLKNRQMNTICNLL